jgi:hypothetical protein
VVVVVVVVAAVAVVMPVVAGLLQEWYFLFFQKCFAECPTWHSANGRQVPHEEHLAKNSLSNNWILSVTLDKPFAECNMTLVEC